MRRFHQVVDHLVVSLFRRSSWQSALCQPVSLSTVLAIALFASLPTSYLSTASAEESTEESIAAYADAANFQTNGAFDLAIEAWKEFLSKYANDDLAPKAAHYQGVCYMQQDTPDYVAAAKSFERALKNKKFELREESLANQGWCWYASAGEGPNRDKDRLKASIAAYEKLQKEKPKSQFLDRAFFYSGEAAYGLGDRKKAIDFYNKLIALPNAKESPLRCDALYARGIAHEEIEQFDKALASFQQLLSSCADDGLVTDVHLRSGDVMIFRKDYPAAIKSFDAAIKSADNDDDKSYAIFRQAFAMVQADRPGDAAKNYDRLKKDFPDSEYAGTAILASAQSMYRSGDLDKAAARFEEVLKQNNPETATEASHWLTRILISKGAAAKAISTAKKQIDAGAKGDYATELKLDLAEAMAMDPTQISDSVAIAESVYRDAPKDPLAPRALYNAAFSALQTNQAKKALELSQKFLTEFPKDQLVPDVQFIAAEGNLLTGNATQASKAYRQLLNRKSDGDNMQRPLWVLRAALASNSAKKSDDTIALLKSEYKTLTQPEQKAEAQMLIGQAYLMSKMHSEAALAFARVTEVDPKWPRAQEAELLSGTALMSAGKQKDAKQAWEALVRRGKDSRMADQARYKLAQLASEAADHAGAIKLYGQIIDSRVDPGLVPYALYGKGWSLMQSDQHSQAMKPLDEVLRNYPKHPIRDEALLARGISRRHAGDFESAAEDLTEFLTYKPKDDNLGHALYELALIDQKQDKPKRAAARLQQLVDQVPKYPSMDKVLYELGWSLREAGDEEKAGATFADLVKKFPDASVTGEAAYFIGQKNYAAENWKDAAKQFTVAANKSKDKGLIEKSYYRLGWSLFKSEQFNQAADAFKKQTENEPNGKLSLDGMMMAGECEFRKPDYAQALKRYQIARKRIQLNDDNAKSIRDSAERQVRELILFHGGQSAAQLKKWDESIDWYDELKARFPATRYLPKLFYEIGFAYQQKDQPDRAMQYFSQVAEKYRDETAARSRFMMGEVYFGRKQFDKAIPEFQRVMFGFGAEKAPKQIKNWQAKSGFEAGRCSELMMQQARSNDSRNKSREIAKKFFQYVIDKHADHELMAKAKERMAALK
ncbi:tetratricopeptide repeat protein [Planctomycetes bacterium K23_9]|uniref:Tol-pal system protein YbgF n=1 Tax=Stieleria marina TaxID=1930275 RepID=A0A517NP97_9BACT|nr:tol-pal system protein YbgF [Planctomycetes bacterium K23_9]